MAVVQSGAGIKSTVFASSLFEIPRVERFTPEPLISHYVSETLIGQRGLTVPLLSLTSPCPAKSNDVTFVAMVHSGASRNMPERGRRGRGQDLVLCLGGHAKTPHTQRSWYILCVEVGATVFRVTYFHRLKMVSASILWPMNLNVLVFPKMTLCSLKFTRNVLVIYNSECQQMSTTSSSFVLLIYDWCPLNM